MKFIIENPTTSVANFFRRAGYFFQKREGEEMAFMRKLTDQPFPRFHLFCRVERDKFSVNIHIDHKSTSYEGHNKHSGEYHRDSKLLNKEIERLKSFGPIAQR